MRGWRAPYDENRGFDSPSPRGLKCTHIFLTYKG